MAKVKGGIVKLREKPLSNGYVTLFLDINPPNKKRYKEYLKIRVKKNNRTQDEKEQVLIAERVRALRENEILNKEYGLKDPKLKKINMIDHMDIYLKNYVKADVRMMKHAIRTFKEYLTRNELMPHELTETIMKGYKQYLIAKYSGETPASYLARFKKYLNFCIDEGILDKSPARRVTITVPMNEVKKEILLEQEIKKIAITSYAGENVEIKKAFLFCLSTGLDFKTVKNLKHENIRNSKLKVLREKVKGSSSSPVILIDLNEQAIKLIGKQKEDDQLLFILPSHATCLSHLKKWMGAAGIKKHITWHSARHSVGTNLALNNTDIKTISSILTQASIIHTQKYLHVVDEIKKKAIEGLPSFEVSFTEE